MGLYTTVVAEFACANCGRLFSTDVQFKTGNEDGDLPAFNEGDRAEGIPAATYEGIRDVFCRTCWVAWRDDEKRANFAALAEAVANDEVSARRGSVVRDPRGIPVPDEQDDFTISFQSDAIPPDEIARLGEMPDDNPNTWPTFGARLGEADFVIFEKGKRVVPTRRSIDSTWYQRHRSRVAVLLRDRGWPMEGEQWQDVAVVVDARAIVSVKRE